MRGSRLPRWWKGSAVLLALLLVACVPDEQPAPQETTPSPTPAPAVFTIADSQQVKATDPALITRDVDAIIATSVFQRLMRVQPGTHELKPDAATDCIFTSELVYECTLPEGLRFHNGNELTSSDVEFSIQRALRFNTAGTGIGLLSSLQRVSAPDELTVRFLLAYPDTQFGFALATLATSIVDEESYDPDQPMELEQLPVGSGPYQVTEIEDEAQAVNFEIFADYLGPLTGGLETLRLAKVADSAAAEAGMADGSVDLIWRTLDDPALTRLQAANDDESTPQAQPGYYRVALSGQRVNSLSWNVDSEYRANATLREAIAAALQADRTLDSLVPVGVEGHVSAFPVGGQLEPATLKRRRTLTLGYDPSAPGHRDLARLLRDRLEEIDSLSVRVVTSADADLILSDKLPWVGNALGWMQSYLSTPPDESKELVLAAEEAYRTAALSDSSAALNTLQAQAAKDLTVLPISQIDGILVARTGVQFVGDYLGSGGQLGLWGIRVE
jgi:peptide/nickel transport system substrate-binding protein